MERATDYDHHHAPPEFHKFCNSRVSMGAAGSIGHWVKTLGILAPLIIGEIVTDTDKRWRYIRLASVTTALISEGLWANRIKRREECREEHETVR